MNKNITTQYNIIKDNNSDLSEGDDDSVKESNFDRSPTSSSSSRTSSSSSSSDEELGEVNIVEE